MKWRYKCGEKIKRKQKIRVEKEKSHRSCERWDFCSVKQCVCFTLITYEDRGP